MAVLTVPRNFSWLIPGQIAALAFPNDQDLLYLVNNGVHHLISLTKEMKPNVHNVQQLQWTDIGVEDYATFSMQQVDQFIELCENARRNQQVFHRLNVWQSAAAVHS